MLASGAAALGYQVIWTQQATTWLGHESAAVLAVVAAFFGGLALGALALAPRLQRSPRPARWYAACEALAAAWALVLALGLAPAGRALLLLMGEQPSPVWQWAVAFGGCFLLLLPASAALGATLPAMDRVLAVTPGAAGAPTRLGWLYAANTLGAMAGVLLAAFVLLPALGLVRSALVFAAIGALAALLAWRGLDAEVPVPAAGGMQAGVQAAPAQGWRLAATGLLGIGHEVLVVRVLGQATESTVYTFALLLAVYLGGTAIGAAAWQRCLRPRWHTAEQAEQCSRALLLALAVAVLASGAVLWFALSLKGALQDSAAGWFGLGVNAALAAEAALAALAFGGPTLLMGALFAQLAAQAQREGLSLARALGYNTLGAAAAPLLVGVIAVPALGAKGAWLALAAGYGLLALRRPLPAVALAAVTVALAFVLPPLVLDDIPPGGRLLSHREGALGAVSVVEDAQGVARLHIDNHQQEGSSATGLADARQALLPLLLHPAPRRALFLGLGTGVTAYSAAQDAGLRVEVVELLPEVIAASARFTQALADGLPPERVRLHAADARRWVRGGSSRFDLVVADNVHPARSGSAALYTVEHFQAVQQRLADGGLFCQWLPLHQLDLASLRSIVRSFLAVYPDAVAVLATHSLETPVLGLLARQGGTRFELGALRQRLAAAALDPGPAAFGFADEWAVLGSVVASGDALARFAGSAVPNTDDHPVVAHAAPRITYAPDSRPRERLLALLEQLSFDAAVLLPADDGAQQQRLAAYVQARRRFLDAGRDVQPLADPARMLAQVREPLLAVLRTSADFQPAYDPLLRLARAVAERDPASARALFEQLGRLQPARPEAAQGLQQLGGS